nr:MAG TPA: RecT protein [Caudoviricetes sp.]
MTLQNSLVAKKTTFSTFITSDAIKTKVNQMVAGRDGAKFITSLISLVSNNPMLAECEHSTILSSALLGESLKLSPSPQLGQFYMVPFNDNKNGRKVAQFQIGYKGYIQLAMRSGQYKDLDVIEIRQGEYKGKDTFTGKARVEFIEDDNERLKLPVIGYFAYFELLNGFRKSLYWTKEKMEQHALTYSQAYKTDVKKGWNMSFWSKDFDSMAFKTMLRQLISKWGIMSIEFQTAFTNDMGVIENDGSANFVDSVNEEPQEIKTLPPANNTTTSEIVIENEDPLNNFDE